MKIEIQPDNNNNSDNSKQIRIGMLVYLENYVRVQFNPKGRGYEPHVAFDIMNDILARNEQPLVTTEEIKTLTEAVVHCNDMISRINRV